MFLGSSSRIEFVKLGGCGFSTLYYILNGKPPVLNSEGGTPPLEVPVRSKEELEVFIKSLKQRVRKLPEKSIFGISNLFYFRSTNVEELREDISLYIEDTIRNYYQNNTFTWE